MTAEVVLCLCTSGRPRLLDRLLGTLALIEPGDLRPGDIALVVVDNRPGDGRARAICAARAGRLPFPVTFVEEREPGISFARNRALAAALDLGAPLIAFIDDDDEPHPDWLWQLVRAQREGGADMVFGAWCHPPGLRPPRLLAQVGFFRPMRPDNRNTYGLPTWAGTRNVLLTRRLVGRLAADGPVFRPEFALTGAEDTDLFVRAHREGFAHATAPDSVVRVQWEADRMTVRGVLRRAFRTGCTRMRLAELHQPPGWVAKLRRRSARELATTLAMVPLLVARPASLVARLVRAAQHAGELYAASGRRFAYYGDRNDAAVASSPPAGLSGRRGEPAARGGVAAAIPEGGAELRPGLGAAYAAVAAARQETAAERR